MPFRIALANITFPATPAESVALAERAIADAALAGAELICFPEAYVPGYRAVGKPVPPPDQAFLERAWSTIAEAAARANVGVVLGTERIDDEALMLTALVVNRDGTIAGFQDKVQIDPSEEAIYTAGAGRRVFQAGEVTFGVAICHEGWRYPETVRWAARRGAHIVFHPHFHEAEPGGYRPSSFADPANTFHEKAILCRAAENTCYVATVNCASAGSPTTSAVARPDGTLLCYQPYGQSGLLVADLDIADATGLLASRCKS
ncbi:MAG: carbon-nitrogen hydrolase family protein [Acidobacteriota bacterium]|nr:carbon-nitrogen hydrolase family protein [Acidobacteriota bacterium]